MGNNELDTDVFEDELIREMLRFVEEGAAVDEQRSQADGENPATD